MFEEMTVLLVFGNFLENIWIWDNISQLKHQARMYIIFLEMYLTQITPNISHMSCTDGNESNHQKMLFQIAVLHYFEGFDKRLPVKVYIFRKAAEAALLIMHTSTGDIWVIWGMILRIAHLKNTSGGATFVTCIIACSKNQAIIKTINYTSPSVRNVFNVFTKNVVHCLINCLVHRSVSIHHHAWMSKQIKSPQWFLLLSHRKQMLQLEMQMRVNKLKKRKNFKTKKKQNTKTNKQTKSISLLNITLLSHTYFDEILSILTIIVNIIF